MPNELTVPSKHTSGIVKSLGLDHSRKYKCFIILDKNKKYVGRIANWGHKLPFAKLNKLEIGEFHWSVTHKLGFERMN